MPKLFFFFFFHSLECACVRQWGVRGLWGRGGHQRWLQHKTAGSGHRVTGLNLPPGNPFRGQVCLLKESQSSRFGVSSFFFFLKEAAIQDIPEINYQLWLIAIYHISWLAEQDWAQSVVFVLLSVSLFWVMDAVSAATDASETRRSRNRDGSSCGRHFSEVF